MSWVDVATSCSTRHRAKVHWIVVAVPLSGCCLFVESIVEIMLMQTLTVPVQAVTSADSKSKYIEGDEFVADDDVAVSD